MMMVVYEIDKSDCAVCITKSINVHCYLLEKISIVFMKLGWFVGHGLETS